MQMIHFLTSKCLLNTYITGISLDALGRKSRLDENSDFQFFTWKPVNIVGILIKNIIYAHPCLHSIM